MTKEKAEKKTKVFNEEFKGNEMFSIWPVNEEGGKLTEYPIINFGKSKARAILKHIDELKKFAEE
jgi:hypothetical protein